MQDIQTAIVVANFHRQNVLAGLREHKVETGNIFLGPRRLMKEREKIS